MSINVAEIKTATEYTGGFATRAPRIHGVRHGADASEVVPARLGVEASPAMVVDAAFGVMVPSIQIAFAPRLIIPSSVSIPGTMADQAGGDISADEDLSALMVLDALHNPILAGIWSDPANDDLIADS